MAYCILKSYKFTLDPLSIFEALSRQEHCFFLDTSLKRRDASARYSFLGAAPFLVFKGSGRDPFPELRKFLAAYQVPLDKTGIPFLGGAVGYFSYDLGSVLEKKLKVPFRQAAAIPDYWLGFYNTVIIIDHFKNLLYLCASGTPEKKNSLARALAKSNLKRVIDLFSSLNGRSQSLGLSGGGLSAEKLNSSFTREGYLAAVKKAKDYIRQGEIYQVNLAQQFSAETACAAPQIYRALRALSPSMFSAFQDCGDFQVISSSPERFLQVKGRMVITRPMKGTRPRGSDKTLDRRLKKELLDSAKDQAELLMITDLERNDLGRVCSYNSIKVTRLRQLEPYATVFQTTATIEGQLHQDKDRVDLLRACFPGGSITGCPKIRAMEIIRKLEPQPRQIYTGCLGYLSFSGEMDFNVLIRTILKKGKRVSFGAGGGIVADSIPEKEYAETLVKAKAMIQAINVL